MTGASWGVSAAGVIVWAACWLVLRHYHHLHEMAHPVATRVAIFFAYVAGCAVALSALGAYVAAALEWLLVSFRGEYAVWGRTLIIIAGLVMAVTVVVGLAKTPRALYAYLAAVTPFVLVLSGGHLHGLLSVVPAGQWVTDISTWIGGK